MSTVTPNMNLIVPVVSQTIGPEYASQVNESLDLVDQHDHSTGQGVPITPDGLSISSDLPFNSNNATLLRTTRFSAQSSPLSTGSNSADVGCVYVSGSDLYYNDTSGNQVRLTQSGGVAGSPGSITNLTSPASAAYVSATQSFVWQSNTNVAANLDARSVIFRNSTVSSFGVSVDAPAGLATDYNLVLPNLPAATAFVTLDASGNLSGSIATANGITRSNLAAVGQVVSSSSGSFSAAAPANITGQTVTITTTGRPVMITWRGQLNITYPPDPQFTATVTVSGSTSAGTALTAAGVTQGIYSQYLSYAKIQLQRLVGSTDSPVSTTVVSEVNLGARSTFLGVPAGGFNYVDTPSAGTYSYRFAVTELSSSTVFEAPSVTMLVYEL